MLDMVRSLDWYCEVYNLGQFDATTVLAGRLSNARICQSFTRRLVIDCPVHKKFFGKQIAIQMT